MELGLEGKVAIVTGGGRGIGKGAARALANEGVDVAIVARDRELLERSAAELADETGRKIVTLTYDAASDDSVRAMVQEAADALGGVDILVNSAAKPDIPPRPTIDKIDDATFWDDVNVKVVGYLRCIREAVPHMERRGGGSVVSIGGLSAYGTGSTIGAIRNISVGAMTKQLAAELAPKHIRLNAIHPGSVQTERWEQLVAGRAAADNSTEDEAKAALGRTSLLGRLPNVDEVGALVAFLASPVSLVLNGESIVADGGTPGVTRY